MIRKKNLIMLGLVITLLVFSMALSACSPSPTNGEDEKTVVFKLGHALPDGHPVDLTSEKFAEIVSQRTNGKIEIQVFPAQQLGNEKDLLEGLNLGLVDMGAIVVGPYGYLQPEYEIFSLVYMFEGPEEQEEILMGDVGQELSNSLLTNKGVRILHPFWYYGTRQLTSNKMVSKPADLSGQKIRVPEVPIQKEGLSAMGAQATPVDFGELYMALQTGVVDGQENPLATIESNNLNQVQEYLVLTKHIVATFMLSINESKFQSLSTEQQQILYDAAEEAAKFNNEMVMKQEEELIQVLENKGMKVVEVDIQAFQDKVNSLHTSYDQKYNGLITRIKEALGR